MVNGVLGGNGWLVLVGKGVLWVSNEWLKGRWVGCGECVERVLWLGVSGLGKVLQVSEIVRGRGLVGVNRWVGGSGGLVGEESGFI